MHASEFAKKRARIERRAGNRVAFIRKAMQHLIRKADALGMFSRGQLVGWIMVDGSVVCLKHRYRNELAAAVDLDRITRLATKRDHIPVRAYFCSRCRGWHLTSK